MASCVDRVLATSWDGPLGEILYRDSADEAAADGHWTEEHTRWHGDDQKAVREFETAGWGDGED